ncbi:MAG TPA: pyridoxine 5'-phosphate synthase [Pseudobdellovibrionaceae bacterium]|nr:pyridoxine 5'-phosphate synthase [Pseudobdellovibrionaceae bacterium]
MTHLSVNINKLATLRNSRGKNNPDLAAWVPQIEAHGVHGITVHPRPDERHIRYQDVRDLRGLVRGEFNIEGYPDEAWLKLVDEVRPHQATLVPDPPHALTSDAGWQVQSQAALLESVVKRLKKHTLRVSLFVDPQTFSAEDARLARELGVDRVELYTEAFAEAHGHRQQQPTRLSEQIRAYRGAADLALAWGMGINAGHDLNLENLPTLIDNIPEIQEVSIGHALICDALNYGMSETLRRYLAAVQKP